jgi:hypothetical protein
MNNQNHEKRNMDEHQEDKKCGAAEHAAVGAGVGAAGVAHSIGLIGLSTGLAVLPISIVIGVVGGLAWWGVRKIAEKS